LNLAKWTLAALNIVLLLLVEAASPQPAYNVSEKC
jgi:hypothetical protein